jgi:hypothetical protein
MSPLKKVGEEPFAAGSCLCGGVTLTIRAKPKKMVQCHCLDCQKSTGIGHTSYAYFAIKDVTINGGITSHMTIAESGHEMIRHFCPECGGRMYGYNSQDADIISIPVGCLEDHSWFFPQVVLFTSRCYNWDITSDQIPNHQKMPIV